MTMVQIEKLAEQALELTQRILEESACTDTFDWLRTGCEGQENLISDLVSLSNGYMPDDCDYSLSPGDDGMGEIRVFSPEGQRLAYFWPLPGDNFEGSFQLVDQVLPDWCLRSIEWDRLKPDCVRTTIEKKDGSATLAEQSATVEMAIFKVAAQAVCHDLKKGICPARKDQDPPLPHV